MPVRSLSLVLTLIQSIGLDRTERTARCGLPIWKFCVEMNLSEGYVATRARIVRSQCECMALVTLVFHNEGGGGVSMREWAEGRSYSANILLIIEVHECWSLSL